MRDGILTRWYSILVMGLILTPVAGCGNDRAKNNGLNPEDSSVQAADSGITARSDAEANNDAQTAAKDSSVKDSAASTASPDGSPSDAGALQLTDAEVTKSSKVRIINPGVSDADSKTLAADNAAFAFDLYKKVTPTVQNLVYSPASISIALAMTYAGAREQTATEMAKTLHYTLPSEKLHPAFNALDQTLASRGQGAQGADGGPFRLHIVNSTWAQKGFAFKAEYLDILAENYGAEVYLLDFIGATEQSRLTINTWVEEQTESKIKDLIPPGGISTLTRLVLTNAVYFNGAWKTPFPENTSDGLFTRLDSSTVTVPLMRSETQLPAVEDPSGFKAVAIPYQDERMALVVVVPDQGEFTAVEASLDASALSAIVASLQTQPVILTLPRFKVETSTSLAQVLAELGMPSAFDPTQADFSGMDGARDLFIQNVLHKAFIQVGEKGTEAAAATAVIIGTTSVPIGLEVRADKPFIYFLYDMPTGAILFMGRVLDPSVT